MQCAPFGYICKNIAVVDMCVRLSCMGVVCCSFVQYGNLTLPFAYDTQQDAHCENRSYCLLHASV
jgi:hypothetical protein